MNGWYIVKKQTNPKKKSGKNDVIRRTWEKYVYRKVKLYIHVRFVLIVLDLLEALREKLYYLFCFVWLFFFLILPVWL